MTRDQWLLTGAWAAMAAVGSFSIYRQSQAPQVDPSIAKLCTDLDKAKDGGSEGHLGQLAYVNPWGPVTEVRPAPEGANRVPTRAVGLPTSPKPVTVQVLPFPVMKGVQSDLNGVVVTWSTEERSVDLLQLMSRTPAKAFRFAVLRQLGDAAPEKIAELGPEARSYTDLSADPRKTYFYRVTLTGAETVRFDRSGSMVNVTNAAESALKATTPANTRLKLIGGDRSHAFVTVETYDRATKKWVGRAPVLVKPGEKVAGWSLKSLRFDDFTLVADMTGDDGVALVLTTR